MINQAIDVGQSVPDRSASRLITQSTHMAAFLATCDCRQPQPPIKGPERVPNTNWPVTKWVFEETATAIEIAARWNKTDRQTRDWEHLTEEEKDIVANFVNAFSDNLGFYLREVKKI